MLLSSSILQRRALRTASEKLRNRSSFSTNVVYNTPGTRVNRYISRLIEARQTESEMADLNFITLKYKQIERENKVRGFKIIFTDFTDYKPRGFCLGFMQCLNSTLCL